ncbi:hypothetical protein [Flexithrix dorotheae]|uniref:hypothetical protein n=1 Tax=Flexithrix dorotheae TaxID=70993 RepID=UPI00036434C1|nr:hypothetical protein [Flexithrix dorotheae]
MEFSLIRLGMPKAEAKPVFTVKDILRITKGIDQKPVYNLEWIIKNATIFSINLPNIISESILLKYAAYFQKYAAFYTA